MSTPRTAPRRADVDPFGDGPQTFALTHIAKQLAAAVQRDEPDGVWRCRYCRVEVIETNRPVRGGDTRPYPERDHVIPRSRGGSGSLSNAALSCQGCNVRKGDRLLSELPPDWHSWRHDLVQLRAEEVPG